MSYCTRAQIETMFGAQEVFHWADLDRNKDGATVSARIAAAITAVDKLIDDRLRGGVYAVPVANEDDEVPQIIEDAAVRLVALRLYEARGISEWDPDTGKARHRLWWHRKEANRALFAVRNGLELDAVKAATDSTPVVVKDTSIVGAVADPQEPIEQWYEPDDEEDDS